jgi:hypothetical protein
MPLRGSFGCVIGERFSGADVMVVWRYGGIISGFTLTMMSLCLYRRLCLYPQSEHEGQNRRTKDRHL